MMKFLSLTVAAAAIALSGCASTPKANVLRFHQSQPITAGTIFLRPANSENLNSLEFQSQANAVAAELQAHGLTRSNAPQVARYTATIDLSVAERMGAPRQSGLSIGLGGGYMGGNVGLGTSVSVPVGTKTRATIDTTTTLSVRIIDTSSNQPLWEGRASLDTKAGGQYGTPLTPVLAHAIFADFPGQSGQTVQVPIR